MNETSTPEPEESKRTLSLPKKIAILAGLTVAGLLALLAVIKLYWDATYFEGYDPDLPLLAGIIEKTERGNGIREKVSFQGTPGSTVPALFYYPKEKTGSVPGIVLLYGIGQSMNFLDDIAASYVDSGFAILCPEQYTRGERKPKEKSGPVQGLLALRERGRLTVIEARRALDYLQTRPEIDGERIYLFGVSLGAILGTSALALEPRFKAGILMWGGGDFKKMFTENRLAQEQLKSYQRLLAGWGATFLKPADPMLRVHLISPRPLLFQNALHDEIIPKVCTEAYFNKAGEPKKILWYDCGHEKGLTEELVLKIIADQIEWLKQLP